MSAKKNLNLKPLEDRIVVKPLDAEEKTAGGILLPDSAKSRNAASSSPLAKVVSWITAPALR